MTTTNDQRPGGIFVGTVAMSC